MYFFPRAPFLQSVSSPSIHFLLLAYPAIEFNFKARINQIFFCFTDLYFPTLINRINIMVEKRSLDILDKEFVHFPQLPSRILRAFLWNYGLVYGSQGCPSLEEQLWNPSLLSNPSLISFDRKQSQNPVVAQWSWGKKDHHEFIFFFPTASPLISLFSLR